jgi:hypothetical protein
MESPGKPEIISMFPEICGNIRQWVLSYFDLNNPVEVREKPILYAARSKAFRYLCYQVYVFDVQNKHAIRVEDLHPDQKAALWQASIDECGGKLNKHECHLLAICLHWFGSIIQKHIENA